MSKKKAPPINVHFDWMIRKDMPVVFEIEQANFEYPWTEEDFIRCLRQRNCIGMAAKQDENVVGFMVYELHRDQIHILNFAVVPDLQRRSIGSQMVSKLIGKLHKKRRSEILLEIRETNFAAQVFFRSHGFKAIDVLRDYYDDANDDAYVFQLSLEPSKAESPNRRITQEGPLC